MICSRQVAPKLWSSEADLISWYTPKILNTINKNVLDLSRWPLFAGLYFFSPRTTWVLQSGVARNPSSDAGKEKYLDVRIRLSMFAPALNLNPDFCNNHPSRIVSGGHVHFNVGFSDVEFNNKLLMTIPPSASLLPTTFVNSSSHLNDLVSRRTAIIAGTAAGIITVVLIIFGIIFGHRRHKLHKSLELSGKKKEGRSLLDREEFDDDETNISGMPSYHHYPTHPFRPEVQSTPSLLKSRISETGSIVKEDAWPPTQDQGRAAR
ncbi:hypothetical protein BYT27DRAFT_7239601 [Phlegmacium glaucopus]|nr:hypothetical protein BYT27DRAFT_7239601 [Phlegmacium glaucopus]